MKLPFVDRGKGSTSYQPNSSTSSTFTTTVLDFLWGRWDRRFHACGFYWDASPVFNIRCRTLFEGSEGEWINIVCAVKFMGQGVWRGIVGTMAHDMELGIKGVLLIEMPCFLIARVASELVQASRNCLGSARQFCFFDWGHFCSERAFGM